MSWKSIRFSIYAVILFAGLLVGIVFLFKFHILLGIAGVVLLLIPAKLQRVAVGEASGRVDKIIAKFVVPGLAVLITLFAILSIALWIKM